MHNLLVKCKCGVQINVSIKAKYPKFIQSPEDWETNNTQRHKESEEQREGQDLNGGGWRLGELSIFLYRRQWLMMRICRSKHVTAAGNFSSPTVWEVRRSRLSLLQCLLDRWLVHGTIKVCSAAITCWYFTADPAGSILSSHHAGNTDERTHLPCLVRTLAYSVYHLTPITCQLSDSLCDRVANKDIKCFNKKQLAIFPSGLWIHGIQRFPWVLCTLNKHRATADSLPQ